MYKKQEKKSSPPLPSDLNSCTRAILLAHHQEFVSRRCLEKDIESIDFADNGWKIDKDGLVVPVWFTCSQLPPSVTKKSKNGKRQMKQSCDANAETEVYEPPKKKMQKSRISRESTRCMSHQLKISNKARFLEKYKVPLTMQTMRMYFLNPPHKKILRTSSRQTLILVILTGTLKQVLTCLPINDMVKMLFRCKRSYYTIRP